MNKVLKSKKVFLFIILAVTQFSFGQLVCSDYPDWVSQAGSVGDQVHYQGSIYQNRYGNGLNPPTGNNVDPSCSSGFSNWCFVGDCSSALSLPQSHDFNSGAESWISGGSKAQLLDVTQLENQGWNTSGSNFIDYNNNSCDNLAGNVFVLRGSSSTDRILTSPSYTMSGYDSVIFDYDYFVESMDSSTEGWNLDYSNDSGSTWTTVKSYRRDTDFDNLDCGPNDYGNKEVVILDNATYSFTDQSKFRMYTERDDGNVGSWDYLVIDNVTLTGIITSTCSASGTILMEKYDDITGTSVTDLTGSANYPENPSSDAQLTSFEISTNTDDDYGVRVNGYICAPQTGYYTFWIASDDNGQLNLSTDDDPANKTTIATVDSWTSSREWDKFTSQKSDPILLIMGESYYVEALMKEGSGGDNLAVGWAKPGESTDAPSEVIPGSVLSPIDCDAVDNNVTNASATADDSQATLSWSNPNASCVTIDEVLVVAKQGSAVTTSPSGDGSAYTASATFESGSAFDGGFVVYKGEAETATITGLVNFVTYHATLFTRSGTTWSSGATVLITPSVSEDIAIQDFDGATPDWSYTDAILGSSTVNLFFEDLTGEDDEDTTGAASGINWTLSGGGGNNSEVYVHDGTHVHMSKNDGTIAIWETTDNIDITSTENLNFTVKVKKTDKLESDDYVSLLYSKNGGALIEIATYYDDMDDGTIIGGDINSLTGNTLIGNPGDNIKLFMHVRNNGSNDKFEWEEIKLTGNGIDGTINSLGTNTTNAWGNSGLTSGAEIIFNTIDTGNINNLTLSFDYFIDSETEPSGDYQDNFVYDIYYNGSETASASEELIIDGGTENAWTSKSVSVPDGTTSVKVIFNFDVTDASNEHLGLDNVKLTGELFYNIWQGNGEDADEGAEDDVADNDNWSKGSVPTATSNVLVPNGKHLKLVDDRAFNAINIEPTANLTIEKTGSLTTKGDFISEGTVTLNSDATNFASIIVEGTATGEITYNKYINYLAFQEWDLVGSPVLNQNMQSFAQTHTNSNNTNNTGSLAFDDPYYALGEYLTEWGSFSNYTTSTIPNSSFPAGKGYQMATNPTGSGNDMEGQTLAFTGEIATASQSINVQNQNGANNNNGRRWNLVSNPYPSYLKANEIADGGVGNVNNFISQNLSIMDQSFGGVYGWKADGSGYKAYNLANLSDQGIPEALLIAPGQGFMIAASSTDIASLQFTPAMRSVVGGDDFISGAPMLLNHFLKLQLFNGSSQKGETSFFFQPNLTLGLNPGYDAGNLDQNTTLSSRLVQDDQGVNLEINAMDIESLYNQSIPLVINQQEGQSFRISISNNTLPEDINVYLEDVFNGTLTSLKNQDFELVAQEDLSQDGRFYIRFTTESLAINDVLSPSSITIFKLNTDNFITIKGLSPEMGKTSAALYNMLGMKVAAKALNSNTSTQTISTQGLASGVYIITLTAGEQAISKKIIIQ